MNVLKIAWRSIQHRGLGSFLTILSMALGVMTVVAVLSVHGVVSQSFKNSSNFGYSVLVGARGGGTQLTMSSIFYLTPPVENIPYEYYLAFCDAETRSRELEHSIAYQAEQLEEETLLLLDDFSANGSTSSLPAALTTACFARQQQAWMGLDEDGMFRNWTHTAIPINLGDYWVDEETGSQFRVVGTKPTFFTEQVLDIETERAFTFAEGRAFSEYDVEEGHGFYEAVIGSQVARQSGLKIGDTIQPTHGDPQSPGSHIHEQDFFIVGILDTTGTPNDRVLFLNMEGFFLMDGHTKSIEDDSQRGIAKRAKEAKEQAQDEGESEEGDSEEGEAEKETPADTAGGEQDEHDDHDHGERPHGPTWEDALSIEQREVTSILIRTPVGDDDIDTVGMFLPAQINQGDLNTTLGWSPFRPERSQTAAQAVNPVEEVTGLFSVFVDPIQSVLLGLTLLICFVSAISILVGIYNSMSQRRHEIAVMRALGASRTKVMMIMLCESVLLALTACVIGWVAGHALNWGLSPIIESRTGVQLGFFDLAPSIPLAFLPGGSSLPGWLSAFKVSPELLLIPGLILLAILVGIYPAISAYRTDVSKSLGK